MISRESVQALMYKLCGQVPSEDEVDRRHHEIVLKLDFLTQYYYQTWIRNDPPEDWRTAGALMNQLVIVADEEVREWEINEPIRRHMENPMLREDSIQEILRQANDEIEMMSTTQAERESTPNDTDTFQQIPENEWQLNVAISLDLKDALRAARFAEDRPYKEIVSDALREYLQNLSK